MTLFTQATHIVRLEQRNVLAILSVLLFAVGTCLAARAADSKAELTAAEFRALVREQSPAEKVQSNLERADEVFFRLLLAQAGVGAARQSLDRLAGWQKVAQARVQTQNAPASDLDLLRFAAGKAAASVARFEADRLDALRDANLLLKRPADSALIALMETAPMVSETPATRAEGSSPAAVSRAPASIGQEVGAGLASRKEQFEKELLPLGNELLMKLYQSYLFGGISLTELLWQEQQVYETDLHYRQLLAEAAKTAPHGK